MKIRREVEKGMEALLGEQASLASRHRTLDPAIESGGAALTSSDLKTALQRVFEDPSLRRFVLLGAGAEEIAGLLRALSLGGEDSPPAEASVSVAVAGAA